MITFSVLTTRWAKALFSGPEPGVRLSKAVDLSSDLQIVPTFRAPLIAGAQPEDGVGLSEKTKESSLCGG